MVRAAQYGSTALAMQPTDSTRLFGLRPMVQPYRGTKARTTLSEACESNLFAAFARCVGHARRHFGFAATRDLLVSQRAHERPRDISWTSWRLPRLWTPAHSEACRGHRGSDTARPRLLTGPTPAALARGLSSVAVSCGTVLCTMVSGTAETPDSTEETTQEPRSGSAFPCRGEATPTIVAARSR